MDRKKKKAEDNEVFALLRRHDDVNASLDFIEAVKSIRDETALDLLIKAKKARVPAWLP